MVFKIGGILLFGVFGFSLLKLYGIVIGIVVGSIVILWLFKIITK